MVNLIYVGNLKAVRDFTDVRDTVRAYWLSLEKGLPGDVYNVCSGKGHKIKNILEFYLAQCSKPIKIKNDPQRLRSKDEPIFIGDYGKLKRQTGWEPVIPFETTLLDILNDWRAKIGARNVKAKN